jgi:hypothetical protein
LVPVTRAEFTRARALRQTLPNLNAALPQALVCVETTCQPPVSDAEKLKDLLTEIAADAAGARP